MAAGDTEPVPAEGGPGLVGRAGPAVAVGLAVLAVWQAVVTVQSVPPVVLPSPVGVGVALVGSLPTLLADAAVTALTAGAGLAAGTAVGMGLAFAMVGSRWVSAAVHPYLIALRIAPLIATAPLVFLWLGDGVAARAVLVTTLTTFPVAVASLDGLRATPPAYLDLMRTVDAPARRVFLRVRVPAAAPSVLAGLRIAAVLSVVGAVVAEFLTLSAGIGFRVFHTSTSLQTPRTYAALVVLAALGLAFYALPSLLERVLRP